MLCCYQKDQRSKLLKINHDNQSHVQFTIASDLLFFDNAVFALRLRHLFTFDLCCRYLHLRSVCTRHGSAAQS